MSSGIVSFEFQWRSFYGAQVFASNIYDTLMKWLAIILIKLRLISKTFAIANACRVTDMKWQIKTRTIMLTKKWANTSKSSILEFIRWLLQVKITLHHYTYTHTAHLHIHWRVCVFAGNVQNESIIWKYQAHGFD